MTLRPQPLPPIPEAMAAAAQAAFPQGNLYVALRTEFGTLYDDQLCADLYPPAGRPVEVAPWRLRQGGLAIALMQWTSHAPAPAAVSGLRQACEQAVNRRHEGCSCRGHAPDAVAVHALLRLLPGGGASRAPAEETAISLLDGDGR